MKALSKRDRDLTMGAVWVLSVGTAGVVILRWGSGQGLDLAVLILVAATLVACTWNLQLSWKLRKSVIDMREQAHYRWALEGLLSPAQTLLPPLGGGAVDARRGYHIVNEARNVNAKNILELGPGASTVLLHLWAERAGSDVSITAVEHESQWAARINEIMTNLRSSNFHLVEAHLKPLSVGQWTGDWFDVESLRGKVPESVDLLVVDGPPNHLGGNNRFPAYPVLRDRLRLGARIYVDDTSRPSERKMVQAWLDMGSLRLIQDGGDFCVLEVA